MIQYFNWMFKLNNFEEHYKYLLNKGLYLFIPALCLTTIMGIVNVFNDNINLVFNILVMLFWILPFLLMSGYFWCLTENIISRGTCITGAMVYDGKISITESIELPELNLPKLLWRGIASAFATIILFLPITAIIFLYTHSQTEKLMQYWNLGFIQTEIVYIILAIIISVILPALLWNYAKQDSIIAVWNLPKAIYIMGTYPLMYFSKAVIYVIACALYAGVVYVFSSALTNIGITFNIGAGEFSIPNIFQTIFLAFALIVEYILALYLIYINAYLLGTVAPPSEG